MRNAAVAAVFVLAGLPATDAAAQTLDIREWTVPWERTRPRDPYVGPDGKVWFVGQTGHYVGRLDPATGSFDRFDLAPGAGPHNQIVAPDGTVWYAGNAAAHIGRLDPGTGKIETFPMPDPAARDPHTLVFERKGKGIWFTVQGGNFIGRFDPATGESKLLAVPTPRARPYGIVVDPEDRPWIALFGTNRIATVDPATMSLKDYALPSADARPRRLVVEARGAVWYADYARGALGRFDPATGAAEEWQTPSGARSRPYAIEIDGRGRIWLVETGVQPNRFVGFDPARGDFFANAEIASGGGTVRHMAYHEPTGTIWFGTDAGTIGRLVVP